VERYTLLGCAPLGRFAQRGDAEPLGDCRDVEGVFRERPEPPVHPATLLGCRPEPKLRAALDALVRCAGNPGGALHRRRITASLYGVGIDGTVGGLAGGVFGSVLGARPSTLDDGLPDVTFDTGIAEPKPAGAREIWERWRTGGPSHLVPGYDRRRWGPAVTLDDLLAYLAEDHIEVELVDEGQPRPAGRAG
jgi:hypothetical protein